MDTEKSNLELTERLKLVETMIAEGRRSTRQWGWAFVLWGAAYLIATVWSAWAPGLAWPVTMSVAVLLCWAIASRVKRGHPDTGVGRAVGAVWIAMGSSVGLVMVCLSASGHYEPHVFVAIVGAMVGAAHATSAMILKWKAQFCAALVWWVACVAASFGSQAVVGIAFLGATFLGQIVFGIYAMILEARGRKPSGALNV